jgi:hypothetical protein
LVIPGDDVLLAHERATSLREMATGREFVLRTKTVDVVPIADLSA